MNVHDTVRASLYNYPMLFANRSRVLHHCFCVIGNGYHWVNGELVNEHPEDPKTDEQLRADTFELVQNFERHPHLPKELLEDFQADAEQRMTQYLTIRACADKLADTPGPFGDLYPVSERYAAILHVPNNVTDDWLAAAKEHAREIASVITPGRHEWTEALRAVGLLDEVAPAWPQPKFVRDRTPKKASSERRPLKA